LAAFGIPQQAHGFFTHRVDALNAVQIVTDLPADDARFAARHQLIQALAQGGHLAVNQRASSPANSTIFSPSISLSARR
jgi:hypothetical protein